MLNLLRFKKLNEANSKIEIDKIDDDNPKTDRSELLLLLTSSELTLYEENVVAKQIAAGKQSVIAVAVHDEDTVEIQQRSVEKIRDSVTKLLPNQLKMPYIFPIRISGSKIINADLIVDQLRTFIRTPEKIKTNSYVYSLNLIIKEQEQKLKDVENFLEVIDSQLQKLENHNSILLKTIKNEFSESELRAVQDEMINLSEAIQRYCRNISLSWKCDSIADDLRIIISENSLLKGQYQMSYGTGKISTLVSTLELSFTNFLENAIKSDVLEGLPITKKILKDLKHVNSLIKDNFHNSKKHIDPYLLRNQISAFDISNLCDEFQSKAEKLVQLELSIQVSHSLTIIANYLHSGINSDTFRYSVGNLNPINLTSLSFKILVDGISMEKNEP